MADFPKSLMLLFRIMNKLFFLHKDILFQKEKIDFHIKKKKQIPCGREIIIL